MVWGGVLLFWLAGALHAPTAVSGLGRLTGLARLLFSLGMGGFSFLWRLLTTSGLIEESAETPHLLWLPLALVAPGVIGLFFYILSQPPNPMYGMQKLLEQSAQTQGRQAEAALREQLKMEEGVPLALLGEGAAQRKVGLDYRRMEGHLLVTAPTRSGKGLHLTETLLDYPGPVLVLDPKAEQYQRTATLRQQLGPVYRIPGHQVNLAAYYDNLLDRDATMELHYHLLRPWASSEPIFAEKALSLFTAVGLYAEAKGMNPLRLLLDVAESNPVQALTGLRMVAAARRHVDIFTNGARPTAYQDDKFVTSALGNFTTRLAPYQKHVDTISPLSAAPQTAAPQTAARQIPPDWASQNGTIYVTYDLTELRAAGGVVAAMVAAMLRYQMRQGRRQPLLVAIDELPAVGLRNITDYLATCGGYGMTLLLYVQSVAQLQELYGREGMRAILANCEHQVWYPAAEMETARMMSELYGTTLKASPMQSAARTARRQANGEGRGQMQTSSHQGASWSWREGAARTPNEMMALPPGQVLVTTRAGNGERRLVFLGQRLNPIPLFSQLPSPERLNLPPPVYGPRHYYDWSQLDSAPTGAPIGVPLGAPAGVAVTEPPVGDSPTAVAEGEGMTLAPKTEGDAGKSSTVGGPLLDGQGERVEASPPPEPANVPQRRTAGKMG
jgi:hypothetical protein